jgi:hypothetical protein
MTRSGAQTAPVAAFLIYFYDLAYQPNQLPLIDFVLESYQVQGNKSVVFTTVSLGSLPGFEVERQGLPAV